MTAEPFDRAAYEDVRRRTRARVQQLAGASWHLWPVAAVRAAGMPFSWIEQLGEVPEDPVRALAGNDRFATALAWQNGAIWDTWFGAVRGGATWRRPGRAQGRERVLVEYLQRYCAKNETIGSFGSLAWARLDLEDEAHDVVACGSPAVEERRTVHIEPWVVQKLLHHAAACPEGLADLPVRVADCVTVAGGEVRLPPGRRRPLGPHDAAVVDVARAGGTVAQARAAVEAGADKAAVVLGALVADGVVQIGPPVPYDGRPQAAILGLVDAGSGSTLRAQIRRLESKVAPLADATGPEAVTAALGELHETLEEIAPPGGGGERHRASPRPFGRTPAYFDSNSTLRALVGKPALAGLRAPLALLLDSASWLCAETAAAVEQRVAELARKGATRGRLYLDEVLFDLSPALSGRRVGYLEEVWEDFRLRWHQALGAPSDAALQLSSQDLRGPLSVLLPARPPRWAAARQHAPDLMLRRRPDGPPGWVLGEVHLAVNTLDCHVVLGHSDDPDELVELTRHDMPGRRFLPLFLETNPDVTARGFPPLAVDLPDRYVYWAINRDSVPAPAGARVFASTGIVVEAGRQEVVARAEGGEWRAPLAEVLGDLLTAVVANRFRLFDGRQANPRITVDDLVLCRRKWAFESAELRGLATDGRLAAAIPEHLRAAGLPRHLFVRSDAERKPIYVDLESRRNVRLLAHSVRKAARTGALLAVSEMLPAPDELWVRDGDGEAYTSELRVVAGWDRP